MSATHLMALPTPVSKFRNYLQLVESIPQLDADEERSLAERWHRYNDLDAARQLTLSHLRYVVYIARRYTGYGLPTEDLIQEGNIGLMKAVRRFDPSRGVRLVAYASYWIRAHIHDFILKNWRIVKVVTTKAKRKLFYKLRSAKPRLDWLNREEAEKIADALDVSSGDVYDMEGQLYLKDESFDALLPASDDANWAPEAYLGDRDASPDVQVSDSEFLSTASEALLDALSALDARSRDIIESRWLVEDDEKLTLQALGDRYQVSAERIRQLEFAAIRQLKELMVPQLGVDRCEIGTQRNCSPIAA